MSNYRTERVRRRLLVAAAFMVAAHSLHWAGVLDLAASAGDAMNSVTLTSYDLTHAEALIISFAQRTTSLWMTILSGSAMLFALLFSASILAAWKLLPRRAASGFAALGMMASFALSLPFAPGSALLEASSGRSLSFYMGGKPQIGDGGGDSAFGPLGGGLPWIDMRAFAGEASASPQPEVKAPLKTDAGFDATDHIIRAVRLIAGGMGLVIGIGFWSTFLGLVAISFPRPRRSA